MQTAQQIPQAPAEHALPLAHLLKSYTSSHPLRSPSPLPPSSRVDPRLQQRLPPPNSSSPFLWTLPTWVAFVRFAAAKGLHIAWSLVKHFLLGPQRPSWGYRMTFITSFMRNVAEHTDFADIVLIRRLISVHYLIPLPADAVVTPITFLVPRRRSTEACRGFLHDWDLAETGTRELSGEWVVGNDVWKRLKIERRARWEAERRRRTPHGPSRLGRGSGSSPTTPSGRRMESGMPFDPTSTSTSASSYPPPSSPAIPRDGTSINSSEDGGRVPPAMLPPQPIGTPEPELDTDGAAPAPTNRRERVIYYVHGGAYYVGNAATHRLITIGVSKACNARVFAITYRLAPEHTFPLPLLDVLHGYLRLLAPPLSIPPENIVIAGDSAGGGLSLALCMYLRDEGYELPAGLVLMSPWVDLTMSCGSWDENSESDVVPRPETDDHLNPVGCYLGPKGVGTYVTHPYASPLFGDLHNLPPMLIQSGDSEVLRDEITLLAHKATLSGVSVTHELYEDMIHVFQMFTWLPASHAAINSVGRWVRQTLPRLEREQRMAGMGIDHVVQTQGEDSSVTDEIELGGPRRVDANGADLGPESDLALASARTPRSLTRTTPRPRPHPIDEPSIDVDSLPPGACLSSDSSTREPSRSPTATTTTRDYDPFFSTPVPRLRRAQTALPSPTTQLSPTPQRNAMRRRRPTAASLTMHVSPTVSVPNSSNPVSPTPSTRRRLRAPTISHPTPPTTRTRSHSHSDIFHLVEGYVEGGAANTTTVYAPGGEIRSVGVLGEDGDEDEEREEILE